MREANHLISEEAILQFITQFAYQPWLVYGCVICFMLASSFGFPIPEEVVLLGSGLVGYIGSRPDLYPPPVAGSPTVNVELLAAICFFAVFLSDFLVYSLGKYFGARLLRTRRMARYHNRMEKITRCTRRYGAWAAGIFRFTPGLRFPGHFACGTLGLSGIKFVAVDGTAALLSVPTQVLLIAYFGEEILIYFKQFKIVLFSALGVLLLFWLYRKIMARRPAGTTPGDSGAL